MEATGMFEGGANFDAWAVGDECGWTKSNIKQLAKIIRLWLTMKGNALDVVHNIIIMYNDGIEAGARL